MKRPLLIWMIKKMLSIFVGFRGWVKGGNVKMHHTRPVLKNNRYKG